MEARVTVTLVNSRGTEVRPNGRALNWKTSWLDGDVKVGVLQVDRGVPIALLESPPDGPLGIHLKFSLLDSVVQGLGGL